MRLIHPIYLDVPMLVSFAAALQGGLSFGSSVAEQEGVKHSETAENRARLGVSSLFSSLFDASLAFEKANAESSDKSSTRFETKSHTEASIAILLYDEISKREDLLTHPSSLEDFKELEPGALIELSGVVEKNAVDSVIDFADAVSILARLDTSQPEKRQKSPANPVRRIREALDEDRKRTPISNVHLNCDEPEGLNAIVTLRTENLRDLTLSELHKNNVRLVGKVTRIIGPEESMSSFENYGLALMEENELAQVFDGIGKTENMSVEFSPVKVKGPAVQILPLMVFV